MAHASLPTSNGLLAIVTIPWLVGDASPQSLPSSSYGVLPVCMLSLQLNSPFWVWDPPFSGMTSSYRITSAATLSK